MAINWRPQLLILEGPDGTGKSTLATNISIRTHEELGAPSKVRRYGIPQAADWRLEWYFDLERDAPAFEYIIHDRGFFGNAVWADLIPESPRLLTVINLAEVIDAIHALARLRVVVLSRPSEEIEQTLAQRHELHTLRTVLNSTTAYAGLARTLVNMGVNCETVPLAYAARLTPKEWWNW